MPTREAFAAATFGFPVNAPPFAEWKADKVGGKGPLKDLTWQQIAESNDPAQESALRSAIEKGANEHADGKALHPAYSKAAIVSDMRSERFFTAQNETSDHF